MTRKSTESLGVASKIESIIEKPPVLATIATNSASAPLTELQLQQRFYKAQGQPTVDRPKKGKPKSKKSPAQLPSKPPLQPADPFDESEKLLRQIDIFLHVKNQSLPKGKNLNFEEYELRNQ